MSHSNGVLPAIVTENIDPEKKGRVKVLLPQGDALDQQNQGIWARIVTPIAGSRRGSYFVPDVDDEVLVAFEHGDMRSPIVLGRIYDGTDRPPTERNNNSKVLVSLNGVKISLEATARNGAIDKGGTDEDESGLVDRPQEGDARLPERQG